jgi:hypothetical protein
MVACCAERTYAATTIADLVSRAAVTQCTDRIAATLVEAVAGLDSPTEATRRAAVAGLELLAAEPELTLVLSGDVVGVDPDRVEGFGALMIPAMEALWGGAGAAPRKHSSPGLAFGRAQLLIFHEVAAGRAAQLPALVPDIVYLATVPFAGHDEALRQARLAGAEAGP